MEQKSMRTRGFTHKTKVGQEGNSVTHDELEVELRKLDPRERARLAVALLNSLEELSDEENARLWSEEAERRHDDLLADNTLGRSAMDVFREIRERLGG
jgi:hypothetical protein